MRFDAVASLVSAALAAVIIAAFPATRAWAQGDSAPAANSPAANPPAASPSASGQPGDAPAPAAASPSGTTATSAAAPAGAPAADAPAAAAPVASAPPPRMVASLSHDLQFGLALLIGGGYRGIFPYASDSVVACGDAGSEDNRVCTARAPVFIDVQPSFGISHSWDFLVDLRFGVEKDFTTFRQFFIMPGFRYWLDVESKVKFFTTLQLAYDRSKQNDPAGGAVIGDTDLGFRNSNGLMVEIMRNFGVYAQFGETIGFYRWLSFMVDAGVGIQARFP